MLGRTTVNLLYKVSGNNKIISSHYFLRTFVCCFAAAAERKADFDAKKASDRSNNLLAAKEAEAKNRELSALAKANKDKLIAEIKAGRDPQREKFNKVFSNGLVNTLTATSLFALFVPRVSLQLK